MPTICRMPSTITWAELPAKYDAHMCAASQSPHTRELRRHQLSKLAREFQHPAEITHDDLVRFLSRQDWSTETRRSYRVTLRGFFQWAHKRGYLPTDPSLDLPPIRARQHPPRPAPDEVWRQAVALADPRVALMILLGARAGLRRGEIASLRVEALEGSGSHWWLRVIGKGGRVRVVPVANELATMIRRCASGAPSGWLFPSPSRPGPLTAAHVGKLIRRALAGSGPGWTAHTLRHRYATTVYGSGRDLLATQQLLGHAKPETTQSYVRLCGDSLRDAALAA